MDEDDLRAVTIGELRPLAGKIELADCDPGGTGVDRPMNCAHAQ